VGYLKRNVPPFSAVQYVNLAIGSQNLDQMIASPGAIDAAYDSSKRSVLIVQEGTNQLFVGDSALSTANKMLSYIAARKALNPWTVVVVTAPPCYLGDANPQAAIDEWNARMDSYNGLLRSRWREAADWIVDIRVPGSPFDAAHYPNYLRATFESTTVVSGINNLAALLLETNTGRIHPSAAGIAAQAPYFAAQLLRTPLRRRS